MISKKKKKVLSIQINLQERFQPNWLFCQKLNLCKNLIFFFSFKYYYLVNSFLLFLNILIIIAYSKFEITIQIYIDIFTKINFQERFQLSLQVYQNSDLCKFIQFIIYIIQIIIFIFYWLSLSISVHESNFLFSCLLSKKKKKKNKIIIETLIQMNFQDQFQLNLEIHV